MRTPRQDETRPEQDAPDPLDPNVAYWRELVRAAPRTSSSPARKSRVLRQLDAVNQAPLPSSRPRPVFAVAAAVALVALVGAVASAAAGGWFARFARTSAAAPSARVHDRVPDRALVSVPPPIAAAHPPTDETRKVTAPAPAADVAALEEYETRKVHEAARALRSDRDPARALKLLDGYFAAYPRGVLREEALMYKAEATSMLRGAKRGRAGDAPSRVP